MKAKVVFIVTLIMMILVLSAGSLSVLNNNTEFSESRKMLTMREIGHQLLLSSGDSISRVLPIRKFDDQTFLIEFENNFTFLPDSLVKVVHQVLSKSEFPENYTVHVMSCSDRSIVYGYEATGANSSPTACLGRKQPSGCYAIQITFAKALNSYSQVYVVGFALAGLTLIGFVASTVISRRKKPEPQPESEFFKIGDYKFYSGNGILHYKNEVIELSRKEAALLKIFAEKPNELIPRDRLLKEVWEDEGVITGRSLDVFVSKLRKKLSHDVSINLVNVHGKGYRLEA
jgi:hypothetical protein